MKYLAVLAIAFVAFVAADEEWKPITDRTTFTKIHDDCAKASGLTTEQNDKIMNAEYADEKEVHDYVHCSAKTIGIFTDDKGYNLDRLMSQLDTMVVDAEKLRDMVSNCMDSNEQKSTPAEWAFRGKQCIMKTKVGEMIKEVCKNKH